MAKKLNELTAQPSTPSDIDVIAWGQAGGSGLAYKMTFTQLKAKLDAMGGGGDVTAPTITARVVANSTPNQINLTFSESVTATAAGFSARRNGSNWAVSSISGSGTAWTLTMATNAANGETLDLSYDAGTGNTVDGSANELASFTNAAVTNNISAGYDADAQAFFDASGISDTTIRNAVNQLVLDMKTASIWTKMKAVYPFVGGTAATHKWNLKNPVDSNAAYRLTFGTLTHDSQGVDFAYNSGNNADTHFNISTGFNGIGDAAFGCYIRNNAVSGNDTWYVMGGLIAFGFAFNPRTSTDFAIAMSTDSGSNHSVANTDSRGMWILSRTSASSSKLYKNGTSLSSFTSTQTTLPNEKIGIGGSFATGVVQDLDYQIAFAFISDGLNDTESSDLSTAVTTFQTALSRNV